MSVAQDLETTIDELEDVIFPPGDLYSDEPSVESDLHLRQILLLIKCLDWWWKDRNDFFASGNLTIYYSPSQRKSKDFRGPDFFIVLGTEPKSRKSWVVWEEDGKYPNLIIEILSPKTAAIDKGLKKQIYQDIFRTPDYFWFNPETLEFAGFHLLDGQYQSLQGNAQGYLWSQQLELYLGIYDQKLRFFTAIGELVPTPEEAVEEERRQKELALQQGEQERLRSERLAAKLRELNIDPDA